LLTPIADEKKPKEYAFAPEILGMDRFYHSAKFSVNGNLLTAPSSIALYFTKHCDCSVLPKYRSFNVTKLSF